MNCNIIRDLLPLYIDNCCSKETKEMVEKHINSCPSCKKELEQMKQDLYISTVPIVDTKMQNPVSLMKASILQVALFFLSFLVMTWGVSWEARIPQGLSNGWFALNLVIPVTAFMLSLANWFFIQHYHSKRQFCICSCVLHCATYLIAMLWGLNHYNWFEVTFDMISIKFFLYMLGTGVVLTVILVILMGVISNVYARLLGKE